MSVTAFLLTVAVYPMLEEYLFRALLLREADSRFVQWRGWRTNLAVSVLFGLAHLFAWPVMHAAAVILPSLFFGFLWQRYQRWWLCSLAHGMANLIGWLWGQAVVNGLLQWFSA